MKLADEDYWERDLLSRKADAVLLHQFILRRMRERGRLGKVGSYVVNLDASWGQGKSFFLHGLKSIIEAQSHPVAYINAWEDDYADDPLLAVVSGIEKAFPAGASKKLAGSLAAVGAQIAITGAKHFTKTAIEKWMGAEGSAELSEIATVAKKGGAKAADELLETSGTALGRTLLRRFNEQKATIASFRSKLRRLVSEGEKDRPIFILIDELDRCRPSYAIAMLERVKHLFEADGIAFVIATDTEQLRHSISAIYGSKFDGSGYLLRFFDRTYKLPISDPKLYIAKLIEESGIDTNILSSPPDNNHIEFLSGQHRFFGLNLRELERCFDMLHSVATMWPPRLWKLQLAFLFPLIVLYCRNRTVPFNSLSRLRLSRGDMIGLQQNHFSMRFVESDGYGSPRKSDPHSFPDLLLNMQSLAATPMHELFKTRPDDGFNLWLLDQFYEEHRTQGSQRFSEIRNYGELVRRVAPLSGSELMAETPPP